MKILKEIGSEEHAIVYLAEFNENKYVEFTESIQPPLKRKDKWVLIISSLFGCPIKCQFCDSSNYYYGKLTYQELLAQIEYPVLKRFPDRIIKTDKFKIQFARIGEPSFNLNVLDVVDNFDNLFVVENFIPSISTVAPQGQEIFFEKLIELKKRKFAKNFQLQFSIHSTDLEYRDWLIPVKKWSFDKISDYGKHFFDKGGKKITLNFAINSSDYINAELLRDFFDPAFFIIKITPINPTINAAEKGLVTKDTFDYNEIIKNLQKFGFDVILSIGNPEENLIGSNCGQYIKTFLDKGKNFSISYTYIN